MKELSIEDKAKRYDEAIKIAKEINNEQQAQPFNVMTRVFPELKESEDERMKNFISNELVCLRATDETDTVRYNELTGAIAWLEKKGEQKPVSNTLKEAFDKSKKDYSLEEKEKASEYSESIIPTSAFYGESEEEYMLHKIIEDAFIAGQNNKYQSAWSEEDEARYLSCLKILSTGNIEQPETVNTVWLKDLKERVLPQPKQEWSEKDGRMVECCKIALEFFEKLGKNTTGFPHENYFELNEGKIYPDEINRWLKSLKERYT